MGATRPEFGETGGLRDLKIFRDLASVNIEVMRNTLVKSDRGEIGAFPALAFEALRNARDEGTDTRLKEARQAVVEADRPDCSLIVAMLRAQAKQLETPAKLSRCNFAVCDARQLTHAWGEFDTSSRSQNRPRIGQEELPERGNREDANERCNHDVFAARAGVRSCVGDWRASSGTFARVYAHAKGNQVEMRGGNQRNIGSSKPGKRFRRA